MASPTVPTLEWPLRAKKIAPILAGPSFIAAIGAAVLWATSSRNPNWAFALDVEVTLDPGKRATLAALVVLLVGGVLWELLAAVRHEPALRLDATGITYWQFWRRHHSWDEISIIGGTARRGLWDLLLIDRTNRMPIVIVRQQLGVPLDEAVLAIAAWVAEWAPPEVAAFVSFDETPVRGGSGPRDRELEGPEAGSPSP